MGFQPVLMLWAAGVCWFFLTLSASGADSFREQIAPVFERRCVGCHNDDEQAGGLSLQSATGAFADGYIEAGDAVASHLLTVITPVNGKAAMPKDADPLAAAEIARICDWINAGATWPAGLRLETARVKNFDGWAFQPVQRSPVPDLADPWVRTPVDAFVLRQLRDKGLTPAPAVDRRTLIRRLTFDLTGLPPAPADVENFINDADPQAYERLVERLLASPHYGERWARHWLDVVKYADTCGYDKDKLRQNAWPYRDYVVRSFNTDKPYSRFVEEQIAGDVLYPGEPDGILGLGFIAAGPWDFIGHVEVPESKIDGKVARDLDRDDMVSNAINTFCSVTIQCARCHHHKFDPFTQEQYYGLQAIFAAVDRAERPYDLDPNIEATRRQLTALVRSGAADLAALQKEIEAAAGPRLAGLQVHKKKLQSGLQIRKAPEFGYHSAIAKSPETHKWVEVTLPEAADISRIVLHACHDDYAGIGAGFGFPVRFRLEVSQNSADDAATNWMVVADFTARDYPNPGLTPVEIPCQVSRGRRIRVTATRLATRQNDYMLALAELAVFGSTDIEQNLASAGIVTALDSIEAPVRWGRANLIDGKWAQGGDAVVARELASVEQELNGILATVETPERVSRRELLKNSVTDAESRLKSLPSGKLVYAAATHFSPQGNFRPTEGRPRPVHVLPRGDITRPAAVAVPGVLPWSVDSEWQFDSQLSEGERRAALARWLTRSDHPLVWRSIVNRIWQHHFGEGLGATPNDFGRMGAVPTHPELLDWLASEFRDRGQSFKSLHRLIVTSSVYRQSSAHHEGHAAIDSGNRSLWRMNRRRLEAEEIRDSMLAVSGALDVSMGGPGYWLFELERPEHSPHFQYHKFDPANPASHRRSIYRFIVRSQPNPWMTTLDCADSSQSTPRRNETLTSLQALSLMNNGFSLAMARRFAQRLREDGDTLPEQVARAIELTIQRPATPEEQRELVTFAETHGLENLCRFLFNLSEFVYLD